MGWKTMKRSTVLLLFLLAGCSTAPVANFQDRFFPGKIKGDPKIQPYGGVCQPQGTICPPPAIGGSPIPAPAPWPPPGTTPGGLTPVPPPPPPPPPFTPWRKTRKKVSSYQLCKRP